MMTFDMLKRFVVWILILGGLPIWAAAEAVDYPLDALELEVDTSFFPGSGAGKFEKGHFILIDRAPVSFPGPEDDVVMILDGQGRLVFQRAPGLDIPDAELVNIRDATLRSPERLVVAAFVRNGENQNAAVLIEYDLITSELVRIVRTFPFQCQSLRADDLGTVWCAGFDSPKLHAREQDYDLVYRFDGGGKLLGTSLPRASFPETLQPNSGRTTEQFGFLPGEGGVRLLVPRAREIIVFADDGGVSDRLALPPWPIPRQFQSKHTSPRYAVASDGMLIAAVWTAAGPLDQRSRKQFLFRLADDGSAWVTFEDGPSEIPMTARLLGVDDSGLILFDRGTQRLVSLPVATNR